MPAVFLNTTTLSAAINGTQNTFAVASNANHTVGQLIVVGSEVMLVQAKSGTTFVQVERGQQATKGQPHQNGATVYGSTLSLGPTEYTPFGSRVVNLPDTPPPDLPSYALPLGTRKRDSLGNEYIMVDFNTTVYPQQPVLINSAGQFIADALATTGRGPIGVVAEIVPSTSDNWGWVQIYGRAIVMLGMSGASPSDAANGPTTLSNSLQTIFVLGSSLSSPNGIGWVSGPAAMATSTLNYTIAGMTVAIDASAGDVTNTTSGVAHTGGSIAVFLNYPTIAPIDITT